MARKAKVHLDSTVSGGQRRALCGWVAVETETDLSRVTCGTCIRLAKAGTAGTVRATGPQPIDGVQMRAVLAVAVMATLGQTAGPPPRLDPPSWASSCKGAEHRRCGSCELCAWEREAQRWDAVSPWAKQHRVRRPEGAPAWPSLAAALVALADWEAHDRFAPSAMGGILARIASGEIGAKKDSKGDDPLLRRAGELVRLRVALEEAYPEDAHRIPQAARMRLLMARTPGVLVAVPTYDELADSLGATPGELQALVREGRRHVTVELAARGLIPQPKASLGLADAIETRREELAHA